MHVFFLNEYHRTKGVSRFEILLFLLLSAMLLFTADLSAQKSRVDTTHAEFSSIDTTGMDYSHFRKSFIYKWNMEPHSPLKATVYSAVLPGLGQIYNGNKKEGSLVRRYWKVPVVYAGLGTCVGFIVFNHEHYKTFKNEYVASMTGGERTMEGTPQQLEQIQEQYHQWRDLSYIALAGVYVLQLIDANVDAHLFYYDVSRDLSMNFHPAVIYTGSVHLGLGLTFKF